MAGRLFAAVKNNSPVLGGLFKRDSNSASARAVTAAARDALSGTAGEAEQLPTAAPIVAVLGAKGGVGTSTIAVNLAAAAATAGVSTTLIDGNLQLPDIANLVGREASHSLLELISRGEDVDRLLYNACRMEILPGSSNLGFLLPPSGGEAFLQSNLSEVAHCLEQIKTYSSLYLIDLPGHLDRHLVTVLDQCAKIILVFEATISGVAACRRWLQIFNELGYEDDRVMLVINRAGSKYKLVEEQMGVCFADRPFWKVPNASSLTWDSSNNGMPIVVSHAGSPYGRAITKLSEDLQKILIVR
jgi:pilus assembly protein CpaE